VRIATVEKTKNWNDTHMNLGKIFWTEDSVLAQRPVSLEIGQPNRKHAKIDFQVNQNIINNG